MKNLVFCCLIASLLGFIHCTSLRSNAIKLTFNYDDSFSRVVRSVYIKVDSSYLPEEVEKMYSTVVRSFNQAFQLKGVFVKEDFTGDAGATFPGLSQPDAWLVLGKPFVDEWRNSPSMPGPGQVSFSSKNPRQRFTIQLLDSQSGHQIIWVGEVSFKRMDARFVGNRVVRQLEQLGLLGAVLPSD